MPSGLGSKFFAEFLEGYGSAIISADLLLTGLTGRKTKWPSFPKGIILKHGETAMCQAVRLLGIVYALGAWNISVLAQDNQPQAKQRTTLWGLNNHTQEAIEVSFGQLTSRYKPNGYTNDTGVRVICQNTGSGASCLRDPEADTGNVPIIATHYEFMVKIAGSVQQLYGVDDFPDGQFIRVAEFDIVYKAGGLGPGGKKAYGLRAVKSYSKTDE